MSLTLRVRLALLACALFVPACSTAWAADNIEALPLTVGGAGWFIGGAVVLIGLVFSLLAFLDKREEKRQAPLLADLTAHGEALARLEVSLAAGLAETRKNALTAKDRAMLDRLHVMFDEHGGNIPGKLSALEAKLAHVEDLAKQAARGHGRETAEARAVLESLLQRITAKVDELNRAQGRS